MYGLSWCYEVRFLLVLCLCGDLATTQDKAIFADITSNKLTRQHDGTWGMWSYHGFAMESHASQTEFIYNADLLSLYGHSHPYIASTVYPNMGLTSDMDTVYQEYLILQSKTVNIDGFLLEWGYQGHPSDDALHSLLPLVEKHSPFRIGVNWCDNWLKMSMRNHTSEEFVSAFHDNLQYLIDSLYDHGNSSTIYDQSSPVITLFGGGITSKQFKEVLSRPLHLPAGMTSPVWIGSYLNFASTKNDWLEWKGLINGTFGWVPARTRRTPSSMRQWDFYANLEDTVTYQMNVSSAGEKCMKMKSCVLWCASVSPGFDNRGCAGWGGHLTYMPRMDLFNHSRLLYDAQWNYINQSNARTVVIATMNDFPEATPILGVDGSIDILYSTEYWSSQWKRKPRNSKGVRLPIVWYENMKILQFYNQTNDIDVSELFMLMADIAMLISHGKYSLADMMSSIIRNKIDDIKSRFEITTDIIDVPSYDMYALLPILHSHNSYYINKTNGLYLQMNDSIATILQKQNFKGLLHFRYQLLSNTLSSFQVYSSSKRSSRGTRYSTASRHSEFNENLYEGNYSVVSNIMVNQSGIWLNATVELYKENQSWDHTGYHDSDLYFITDKSPLLISNISLTFHIYRIK